MGIVSLQRYNGIYSIISVIRTVWARQNKWVGLFVGWSACWFVLHTALCHLDLINTGKMFCQLH
jgi:hypothetical protein